MNLIYLDCETTGLDPFMHDVFEVAYATDTTMAVRSLSLPHTLEAADPQALKLNGYFERGFYMDRHAVLWREELLNALRGATIVGSNPAFDAAFLRRKLGVAVWHHRLFDVSAYAAGVLGLDDLPGLAKLGEALRERGYDIPEPDHTAAKDVEVVREVHQALTDIAAIAKLIREGAI
jgi:DNA polymerase-3 subunit epsilon